MSKTNVKITGFTEMSKKLTTYIENVAKDQEMITDIGKHIVTQIRARTASGVDKEYKQPPITKGTIKRRESLMKAGNTPPSDLSRVLPRTSGLTLSGQLLNSLRFEINASLQFIRISIADFRRPYRGVRKEQLETKTNTEIKDDLESRGRKFFFLSDQLREQVQNILSRKIREKIRKAFRERNRLKLK